jgi:hypothetical protein
MTRGDGDLTAADLTVCGVDHDLETTPRLTSTAGRRPAVPSRMRECGLRGDRGGAGPVARDAGPRPAPLPLSRSLEV